MIMIMKIENLQLEPENDSPPATRAASSPAGDYYKDVSPRQGEFIVKVTVTVTVKRA